MESQKKNAESENAKPKVSALSGSDTDTPFLQLRELVPLEHLRFATSNRVDGPYNGRHRSRTMGGSGEFADYRAYSDGDDLRRLDWRVLGRTGRAYIKQYQEDTNLSCLSVIDCSGSMMFDGREDPGPTSRWLRGRVDSLRKTAGLAMSESSVRSDKLNYAQYFVTALTHLIVRGGDQASLGLIGDGLHLYHEPGSTESHARQIYEAIETIKPATRSNLSEGLETLIAKLRRRGVLLLVSDFLLPSSNTINTSNTSNTSVDPKTGTESETRSAGDESTRLANLAAVLRRFRHQGWEIVMLHLIHPSEESLPDGVSYHFEGLEGESSVNCRIAEIRELYLDRWRDHLDRTQDIARSMGADYRRVSTSTPYLDTLSDFLVQRSG